MDDYMYVDLSKHYDKKENIVSILTRENAQAAASALCARGAGDAPVQLIEPGQGPGAVDEAARAPVDVLLLDIDTGPGLGPAVLRFRLARKDARIVLLAIGRTPGDAEVAQVCQSGVYDIVTEPETLAIVLASPARDLSAAALWLDPSLGAAAQSNRQTRIIEVEKRVPMVQRPILIVVTGVAPGVGITTMSCAIAGYLAGAGYKTALVIPPVPKEEQPRVRLVPDAAHLVPVPGLDYIAHGDPQEVIRRRQHEYIIADTPPKPPGVLDEIGADVLIVLLPPVSRVDRFYGWAYGSDTDGWFTYRFPKRAKYAILGGGKSSQAVVEGFNALSEWRAARNPEGILGNALMIPLVPDDWPPGYQKRDEPLYQAIRHLLQDVLPAAPQKRSWLLPWKRVKTT